MTAFDHAAGELPGAGWVAELRRDSIGKFARVGLPHRRIEEWKYTDLRERFRDVPAVATGHAKVSPEAVEAALGPLAGLRADRIVLIDGIVASEHARLEAFDGIAEIKDLRSALTKAPEWLAAKFSSERISVSRAIPALNLAFMSDGVLLKVKPNASADRPLMLVHVRTTVAPASVATRNIVTLEDGARLTLIEAFVSVPGASAAGHGNYATDVDLAPNSALTHIKCVTATEAAHLSTWRTRIGKDATYIGFQLTAGAPLARNEIDVDFEGSDARLDMAGVFLGRGTDHIDTTLVVDHATPGCESRELFKGILDGRARGVVQGKVVVHPIAQKTDGKQMAQVLMLSEDAEFDSKPELEIYADDVVCGHGSTSTELDADMMFYLRSRGIPKMEARSMLIESFVAEAIDKIEDEAIREALRQVALDWLKSI